MERTKSRKSHLINKIKMCYNRKLSNNRNHFIFFVLMWDFFLSALLDHITIRPR